MTTATAEAPRVRRRRPSLRSDSERNALVEANIKLVYGYLHRRWRRYADDDDVIQAGRVGLIRAAELWEAGKGAFSTYAEWWMRQAVKYELESRSIIHVSRQSSERYAADAARVRSVASLSDAEINLAAPANSPEPAEVEGVRIAFANLSLADQTFVRRRLLDGESTGRMAAADGVTKDAIRSQWRGIKRRLRGALERVREPEAWGRGLFPEMQEAI